MRHWLIVLLLCAGAPLGAQSSRYLAFLYMDANIDGSSGGHLAAELGDFVYHFQFTPDQVFTLIREKPEQFVSVYNQNENRSITVTPLELDRASVDRIKAGLDSYFLIQQKYIRLLALAKQDAQFIEALRRKESVQIEHTGYFVSRETCSAIDPASGESGAFNAEYWARILGPAYAQKAEAAGPLPEPFTLPRIPVAAGVFADVPPSYSQLLSERVQLRAAKAVLAGSSCPGAPFIATDIEIDAQNAGALRAIADDLKRSLRALLFSTRPDRGGAMLLTMARIVAVDLSLRRNRLTVLDTTPQTHQRGERRILAGLPGAAELPARARRICRSILEAQAGAEDRSRQLNLLENCAARYFELTRTDPYVRYYTGSETPRAPAPVVLKEVLETQGSLFTEDLSRRAAAVSSELERDIQSTYSFHLIQKNCATELLAQIVQAFPSEQAAKNALGGSLYPRVSFIPAVASLRAQGLEKSEQQRMVRSRRLTQLEELYRRQNALERPLLYLRESNVFTSTLYSANEDDTMFLFFTDDALVLRPVYGVFNVAYGIVQSGLGCARLPFDGGKRLKSGVRGILFSLPELVFFNIRKGSYPVP